MRLLFCCDLYHPSVGGVQEVMRQVAEHMVQNGHQVTVATRRHAARTQPMHNGVAIAEFDVSGDLVSGLKGEVDRYRDFISSFPADAVMIKAAHQWSFDASWPVLDRIAARKVFIPCGLSQFFNPAYRGYFAELPAIMRKFDRLIFYAEHYRDIDFARAHGLTNFSIVPNGASEIDFAVAPDPGFRRSLGVAQADVVILTVGSPPDAKGHREVAAAFARMDPQDRSVSLILAGSWDDPAGMTDRPSDQASAGSRRRAGLIWRRLQLAISILREHGVRALVRRVAAGVSWRLIALRRAAYRRSLDRWVAKVRAQPLKSVLQVKLPRDQIIQAFLTADLFVFASRTEYSPLVLFEAAAAGTPFISVPVGNAEEIARWTGAGVICPARRNAAGDTRVSPRRLAQEMARLVCDEGRRRILATRGREAWQSKFNWKAIAARYESVLTDQASNRPAAPDGVGAPMWSG